MMVKRLFNALPGPTPVRIVIAAIILIIGLIALGFIYDWMGNNILDTGGTIS